MAVNMSKKDQDALAAAGAAWNKANAAGDEAGKAAAHAQAEAIRNNYGYSGGGDGSKYIPTSKPSRNNKNQSSGGGYTPAGMGSGHYSSMVNMSQADKAALGAAGDAWIKANAAGDEAGKAAAHARAEAIRGKYMYSGGGDGSEYLPMDQMMPFPYQPYENLYQEQIDRVLGSIMDRDPFRYNYLDDPLYHQYEAAYQREGERAMQDAMGQAAARTGGLASSYATAAANQANNYYMAQLGDKIPELQQLAYSMYVDDRNYDAKKLDLLQGLENMNYGRWGDDLSFRYGMYRDNIGDSRYDRETAYEQGRYEEETAYERALHKAETLAQFGNFSGYRELGYTQGEIDQMERQYLSAQNKSSGGGRGTGSGWGRGTGSAGGKMDYDGLFEAAKSSGYPKSYIANQYKKYGFQSSSGLYGEYEAWLEGAAGEGMDQGVFSQQITALSSLLSQSVGGGGNTTESFKTGQWGKAQSKYEELWAKANEEQRESLNRLLEAYGVFD